MGSKATFLLSIKVTHGDRKNVKVAGAAMTREVVLGEFGLKTSLYMEPVWRSGGKGSRAEGTEGHWNRAGCPLTRVPLVDRNCLSAECPQMQPTAQRQETANRVPP